MRKRSLSLLVAVWSFGSLVACATPPDEEADDDGRSRVARAGESQLTDARQSCASDADCHRGAPTVGFVCANDHVCRDGCHSDADCDELERCDTTSKPTWTCTAAWPRVGQSCATDEECGGDRSGRVCANSGATAGTCIVGCHGNASCPSGATCDTSGSPWVCVGPGGKGSQQPPIVASAAPKDVPYECQYSNAIAEGNAKGANTCATTSTSMVLRYFGIPLTAKQYFDAYRKLGYTYDDAKSFTLIPKILEGIPQAKGKLRARTLTSGQGGTTADLKKALDDGYVVIVGANLFQGHVLVVTGYDAKGVYVNDPAGVWHPSLGNTGAAYDRCWEGSNNAKGDLSYEARNVFCGENAAVHLCGAKADLWMLALKPK